MFNLKKMHQYFVKVIMPLKNKKHIFQYINKQKTQFLIYRNLFFFLYFSDVLILSSDDILTRERLHISIAGAFILFYADTLLSCAI